MDLCGPMRVASVNGKNYILVIVDDYSRFTWVKFLASKDEAPNFIIKFLKMIQVRLNATVRNIRTDNRTEFVNQTLSSYYESVGLVPNPTPPAPFVPPSRKEWDLVFYLVFDEFFSTPASVASPVPAMEAPAPVVSTGTPSSTTVDQDASSPKVAHICNDSCFGIPSQATAPKESSKTTQFNDDPLQETLHEESTS
ncbi:retrovirus-related pol polyprotein from transposon TNT 1-94 [Tanacetum coccineum]